MIVGCVPYVRLFLIEISGTRTLLRPMRLEVSEEGRFSLGTRLAMIQIAIGSLPEIGALLILAG